MSTPETRQESIALRILLVDDAEVNRMLVCQYLSNSQHKIDTATNGAEAVDLFKLNKYDLILMDIQMPEMDGFQATRKIREIEAGASRVPVIALTAQSLDQEREKFEEYGCSSYLGKPLKKKTLLEVVQRYMDAIKK